MIARRTALIRTLLLTFGSVLAWIGCASPRRTFRNSKPDPSLVAEPSRTTADLLTQDLARLGKRTYSDQGIGVLLVCENRVAETAESPRTPRRGGESRQLAAEFRRQVELFKQLHPNRTDDDVPKLIEVLADRDLAKRTRSTRP